jgi:hypothetical protein
MRPVAGLAAALIVAGFLACSAAAAAPAASAAPAATAAAAASAAAAARAASGGGGCDPYVDGTVVPVPCSSGSGSSGSPGSPGSSGGGGSSINNKCTMQPIDEAQAQGLGLAWPPPKGQHWALLDCFGGNVGPGPQAVLVNNVTGAPQITPQQLLVQALRELKVPTLSPATAPPRGKDGLVGLPEWFWVPDAQWHARSVTVTAGPVWATATAMPVSLTIQPGAGLGTVSCTGPGTAYDSAKPATGQQTSCSYIYPQPSAGLPGNAYQVTVTVTWRISWTGSGGAGGVLDPALTMPAGFALQVAQGEALVTSP